MRLFVGFIEGSDRNQVSLLPSCVEDYVVADSLVRIVDAFVSSLDLADLGFNRAVSATTGRSIRRQDTSARQGNGVGDQRVSHEDCLRKVKRERRSSIDHSRRENGFLSELQLFLFPRLGAEQIRGIPDLL